MTTRGNIVANADVMDRPLPDGWEWARLEDVCEPIDSVNPRQHPDTSFKYVDISSIDRDRKEIVHPKETIGRDAPSRARQEIEQGDVLVSTTRPNLNAVAQVPYDLGGEVCSTGFCVLRPGPLVLSDWVFQYVRLREFVTELDQLATGSSYPAVTDKQVKSRQLPVPPLPQQHRIVRALQERTEAIDSAKRAAEAQLEAANAMSAACLREVFPAEGAELPEGWEWVRLGDVCRINPRKPLTLIRHDGAPTTFVPMSAIDGEKGSVLNPEQRRFEEVRRGYSYFEDGDVLFAKITPCMQNGKHFIATGLIDGIGFGTTELHVIRPADSMLAEWIHSFLRQPSLLRMAMHNFRGSAGQQRVPAEFISNLRLPLPSVSLQRRIIRRLQTQSEAIDALRSGVKNELNAVTAMSEAYLRAAFDGSLG